MIIKEIINIEGKSNQYSINICRDYRNTDLMNSYIPNFKNLQLMNKIKNHIVNTEKKAVQISGSYGTGKSYLLSVLLNILTNKESKVDLADLYKKAISQYSNSDELFKLPFDKPYLLVFFDDSKDNFKISLMQGVYNCILENNLKISLKTTFQYIKNKIDNWKDLHLQIYNGFLDQLTNYSISLEHYFNLLYSHEKKSIEIFKEIYKELFPGEEFNTFNVKENIKNILFDFQDEVINTGLYCGVLYIFDEFGRYLETNMKNIDVKEIQDMAEYVCQLSSSSFITITHKDMFQYIHRKESKDIRSEWEKVSGRFYKEHITYEKSNFHDIIKNILTKKISISEFNELDFVKLQFDLVSKLRLPNGESLRINENLFDSYPLDYFSFKILPDLSQVLAQNERTLFSFLFSEEEYSLKKVLEREDAIRFIKICDLYNYFENNFIYLPYNGIEQKSYYNAKIHLKKLKNEDESNFVKTLAMIYIYNSFVELEPKKEVLQALLHFSDEKFDLLEKQLKKLNIISYRTHSDHYKLVDDIDINIEKEINKTLEQVNRIDSFKIFNKAIPLNIYYPINYNYQHKITRFIKKYYIDLSQHGIIENIIKNPDSDSVIFYITDLEGLFNEKIETFFLKNKNVIFIFNPTPLDLAIILKEIEAIEILISTSLKDKENSDLLIEILDYQKSLMSIVEKKLKEHFVLENCICYNLKSEKIQSEDEFDNSILSYLNQKFPKYISESTKGTPIYYELINKNILSHVMKKNRLNILEKLDKYINNNINFDKDYFDLTGSENSLARNVLRNTKLYKNDDGFDFIGSCYEELYHSVIEMFKNEVDLKKIYNEYCGFDSQYGFRKGVFTFIIIAIIIKHEKDIVITLDKSKEEIDFNLNLVNQLEDNPDNYKISYIKYTENQDIFLNDILKFFTKYHVSDKNVDLAKNALKTYQNFVLSVPNFILNDDLEDDSLMSLLKGVLSKKNSREFWFVELPHYLLKNKGIDFTFEDYDLLFEEFSKKILSLKERIDYWIEDLHRAFVEKVQNVDQWVSNDINKTNKLYNFIENNHYKDTKAFIISLTKHIMGFDFYNWRYLKDIELFKDKLNEYFSERDITSNDVTIIKLIVENQEHSIEISEKEDVLSSVLKQKLKSDIKNMGSSLTEEQKKKILMELLIEK